MIIAIDIDHTITASPEFYRQFMAALRSGGAQVHVLSGSHAATVTPEEVAHKLSQLSDLGFERGREYDEAIAVPGPEKDVPANKVGYMRHVGASALFDDDRQNCKAARAAGFFAFRHKVPK